MVGADLGCVVDGLSVEPHPLGEALSLVETPLVVLLVHHGVSCEGLVEVCASVVSGQGG